MKQVVMHSLQAGAFPRGWELFHAAVRNGCIFCGLLLFIFADLERVNYSVACKVSMLEQQATNCHFALSLPRMPG